MQIHGNPTVGYPGLTESDSRHRALTDFCQMLLASNSFLYID